MELREILLSFQTSFNLVNAAVACVILENISSLEPSSVITEPRYLKLVTVSSFCPLTLRYLRQSKYLGSVLIHEDSKPAILSRIAQTTTALTRLKPILSDRSISLSSKID